jgi:hypothetical protein
MHMQTREAVLHSRVELEKSRRDRGVDPLLKAGLESVECVESNEARRERGTSRHKSTGSRIETCEKRWKCICKREKRCCIRV